MKSSGRLFIADPSLKDTRGHHYSLTKSIDAAACRREIRTFWLTSMDASVMLDQHADVVPTFELTMYAPYMQAHVPKPSSFLHRTRQWIRDWWGRFFGGKQRSSQETPVLDLSNQILRDLSVIMRQFEVGADDRILFHSADGATFEALAKLVQQGNEVELPTLHVCTPYDPEGVMPNRKNAAQLVSCIETFRQCGVLGTVINLYAENSLLADHLSKVWATKVETLSLPGSAISDEMILSARHYRTNSMKTQSTDFVAVSLGAARLEKGFALLPDIIEHAHEIANSGTFGSIDPLALKFVLHASPQIIGRHPEILKTLERLKAFPENQVKLLLEPLSDDTYRDLTLASDCILMPYDVDAYRVRGSGIVTEAIVAQKPILAKSGSYPAAVASDQGGATGENVIEMAQALIELMQEREARAGQIKAFAEAYLVENSADKYIDRIWRARRGNRAGGTA